VNGIIGGIEGIFFNLEITHFIVSKGAEETLVVHRRLLSKSE
jgi:hypothetical protein